MEESRRKIGLAIDRIQRVLADGPWLAGASYSLADIDTFAIARALPRLTPDLTEDKPRFAAWLATMEARPAVRTALQVGNWAEPETAFAPGPEHARWG